MTSLDDSSLLEALRYVDPKQNLVVLKEIFIMLNGILSNKENGSNLLICAKRKLIMSHLINVLPACESLQEYWNFLINLTAEMIDDDDETGGGFIQKLWLLKSNSDATTRQNSLKTLCNLTQNGNNCKLLLTWIEKTSSVKDEVNTLYENALIKNEIHSLSLLSNLSQLLDIRKAIINHDAIVKNLIPLIGVGSSFTLQHSSCSIFKNLAYENQFHTQLLCPDLQFIVYLLLPLAGPEEFDDDENDLLALQLQFLEKDKKREADPQIRRILLEIIYQLCGSRLGRVSLREHGAYYILREYHKWEKHEPNVDFTFNIIDFLLDTEPAAVEAEENTTTKEDAPEDS